MHANYAADLAPFVSAWNIGLVASVTALGFALRFGVFRPHELGLDGHLSLGLAVLPIADMVSFNVRDVHPPLFYAALGGWLGLFGANFVAAKAMAVAAGTLSIPALYAVAFRLFGPMPALAAAVLLAISPVHIFISATVRDFGLGLLLSCLSILLVLKALDHQSASRPHSAALLVALAAMTAAGMLTWYFHAAYLLLLLGVLLVARPQRWLGVTVALLAGSALSLPWLAMALPPVLAKFMAGTTAGGGQRAMVDLAAFVQEIEANYGGRVPGVPGVALMTWTALFVAGIFFWIRGGRRPVLGLVNLIVAAGSVLLLYLLASLWVQSLFIGRYLVIAVPVFILGQAAAFAPFSTRARTSAAAALLTLLLPAASSFWPMLVDKGIPYASNPGILYLESRLEPGDAVVVSDVARLGYLRLRNGYANDIYVLHFAGAAFLEDDVRERSADLLPDLLSKYRRVWFFNSEPGKPEMKELIIAALGLQLEPEMVKKDDFSVAEITPFGGPLAPGASR